MQNTRKSVALNHIAFDSRLLMRNVIFALVIFLRLRL